jgi:uncharacterized membrane protein YjjB (DUF3815 family)
MATSLAAPAPIAALVAGGLLLLFGRRLFWLFVGVVGFVVAYRLAGAYLGGEGAGWVAAIAVGALGAVAAVLMQKLAVAVAGLAAGAVGFFWLSEQLGWAPGLATLVGALVAGLVGAALLRWLFELGLVALSVLVGAALIVEGLGLEEPRGVAFLVLAVVGALLQLAGRRRLGRADE